MKMSQGAEANHSGQMLENVILREFKARKVPDFPFSEDRNNGNLFADKRLIRNAPFTAVNGCESRSEFLYVCASLLLDVRIECKWQQVSGSVDEKLSFTMDNAIEAMPEKNIWIIVDGGGARQNQVGWIIKRAQRCAHKNIRVLTLIQARPAIKRLVEDGEP